MNKTIETIRAAAASAKRLKTSRALYPEDVDAFEEALQSGEAKRRVRVYSSDGFVPNAYRHRCEIQYVEAIRDENGEWVIRSGWTGAQRSKGSGSLVVIQ